MADDPLDDWIDGLSGKRPARPGKDEAAVVRQLILAEQEQARVESAAIPATQPGESSGRRRRTARWAWSSGFGVAAALVLGVALYEFQSPARYPPEPVLRSDSLDVQTLHDQRPRARAESLAGTLRAAGASVGIFQHGDMYVLDVVVLPENAQSITQVLKEQGLDAPHRSVRIQIKPR